MTFSAGAWQQQHSVSAVKCQTQLILYSCGKMQTRLDRRLALCPPTTCASEGSAASGVSPRYSHEQMQLFLPFFTVSLLMAAQMEGMCPKINMQVSTLSSWRCSCDDIDLIAPLKLKGLNCHVLFVKQSANKRLDRQSLVVFSLF